MQSIGLCFCQGSQPLGEMGRVIRARLPCLWGLGYFNNGLLRYMVHKADNMKSGMSGSRPDSSTEIYTPGVI